MPETTGSLRIFLSYGHDSNEELVLRIKADLENRRHDVWLDKSEIKFGDDWRRSITDGIAGSNRVLSFLSRHSTRDPGVCLDEIGIAIGVKGGNIQTILVESETEVKPPASISHLQWLDMHDWKERFIAGGASWDDWYGAKLAEIVRVVESDESRRFAGEIETLSGYLKPISSSSRIAALLRKGFVGRTWLAEALERWRTTPDRASRIFWITGDPGVGKSAFIAHMTHFGRDKVIAAQFVEWDKPDHRDARRVVRSLTFQLATRLPDYRRLLLLLPEIADLDRKDPAELFDYLLVNPLRTAIAGGRERYLIVIDALDEGGDADRNPIVEVLARNASRLPDWLGLVVTSRPESAVQTPLQGLSPFVLDTRSNANRADLRDFLWQQFATHLRDRPGADGLVEQILAKSEGVFLYVERFAEDVQNGHLSLDRPEQFPEGLGGIFFQWFHRQFPDIETFRKSLRYPLRAILAAREPLPVEILRRLFNWEPEELRDFTRLAGSLFPVTKDTGTEVIKPFHKSLADWLADEAAAGSYFVSRVDGHRMLADHRLAALTSPDGCDGESLAASGYWARRLLHHCYAPQDWEKVVFCIGERRVFQSLWPGSYGCDPVLSSYDPSPVQSAATSTLGFYRGAFGAVETDALIPSVLESLADDVRIRVGWALATAFADRTREQQVKASSYAKQFVQHSNTIRTFLKENHPAVFLEYRDAIYSFVALSRSAPQYALAAYDRDPSFALKAKSFVEKYGPISSYLGYLADFARNEGWSGQLEDEAFSPHRQWENLEALAHATGGLGAG